MKQKVLFYAFSLSLCPAHRCEDDAPKEPNEVAEEDPQVGRDIQEGDQGGKRPYLPAVELCRPQIIFHGLLDTHAVE